MDPFLAVIISGVVSILVAYLTAQQKTKTELSRERAKADIQVQLKQKHDYFHPFKHNADEFRGRLGHVLNRLVEDTDTSPKKRDMVVRLSQDFESKELSWFYDDSLDLPGGYFLASTVYLNCLFFYWVKRIQHEQPFMTLDISKVGSSELAAYQELATRHTFVRSLAGNTCDIYDFTKSMRVAIALAEGIPFGLHDAIGDLVLDRESGSFSNYNDFCEKVISEADKVKFKPVLNFWTNIVNENGDVNAAKIEKIQSLHIILNVLKFTQIQ